MDEAKEYIKRKHNGEIPYKYGANECAKLMTEYAKYYHESKVKPLFLNNVSDSQFEAYAAFCIELDRQRMKPIKYKDYLEIG